LARRGAASAAADPFKHPANAGNLPAYAPDMLPRTTEHLSRTALLAINLDWDAAAIDEVARILIDASRQAGSRAVAVA
ncbi:MAG: hypothetical protein H0W72_14265, partial [Planctomycetes bacterium]|nr:hypothetical protein [Planctomycetota bacterium]